jgi:hypothetical protein
LAEHLNDAVAVASQRGAVAMGSRSVRGLHWWRGVLRQFIWYCDERWFDNAGSLCVRGLHVANIYSNSYLVPLAAHGECAVKYFSVVGLFVAFLVAATYALKAEWIRNRILQWTARANGTDGLSFRLQRWFVGNALYVTSFRIVAGVVAICLLVAIVYLVTVGPKN